MQAVVTDPNSTGHFSLQAVPAPNPQPHEALVQVSHIAINRGEAFVAAFAPPGMQLGWDLVGTITVPAADGSGPAAGTQVVALVPAAGWAEQVAVPTQALAPLPAQVSPVQAAALPVAGLTAWYALQEGGSLSGKKVLVTGATGGVGHFAVQLARLLGAGVHAQVRQAHQIQSIQHLGAEHVWLGDFPQDGAGPYDLIVDGVGGPQFRALASMLAPHGTLVTYGGTAGSEVQLDLNPLVMTGGTRIVGLSLFHQLAFEPASSGLERLLQWVQAGELSCWVGHEASWKDLGQVACALLERRFAGKAVLHLD